MRVSRGEGSHWGVETVSELPAIAAFCVMVEAIVVDWRDSGVQATWERLRVAMRRDKSKTRPGFRTLKTCGCPNGESPKATITG